MLLFDRSELFLKYISFLVIFLFLCSITGCRLLKNESQCQTIKIKKGSIEEIVTGITSGRVTAEQEATLGFAATGRIANIFIEEGEKVEAGQLLAVLDNSEQLARLTNAEQELKRLQTSRAVARSQLDKQSAEFKIAKSLLNFTEIRAPFKGEIVEIEMEVGENIAGVGDREKFIKLVDNKNRFVEIEIDELDRNRVKIGTPARIKVLAFQTKPLSGRVRRISGYVNNNRKEERTVKLEIDFNKQPNIPVGASADLELVTQKKNNILLLPITAIVGRGGKRYVFKIRDSYLYEHEIFTGISNYRYSEITKGLKLNQEIVLNCEDEKLEEGILVKESS
jgi:HlyD family secretion protein